MESCQNVANEILAKVWTEHDLDLELYAEICGYLGNSDSLYFTKTGKQYFTDSTKNVKIFVILSKAKH